MTSADLISAHLIADIGGTNARFALRLNDSPFFHKAESLNVTDFYSITAAIDAYLEQHAQRSLKSITMAVAGPIKNQSVRFLNNNWSISTDDLYQQYQVESASLLNDWHAIALSLNKLKKTDVIRIGTTNKESLDRHKNAITRVAAIGPGSGLGIAGLITSENNLTPIITEGGHAGFAPETPLQVALLDYLHKHIGGRVSRERLLSGPGIVTLYQGLCAINDQTANTELKAADISRAGLNNIDTICQQSMALFFEILGQVAGDTALELGAYDGVYIGGGICQRFGNALTSSEFRKGFENKGRYQELMKTIPTWLITHPNPGLLGASYSSHLQSS